MMYRLASIIQKDDNKLTKIRISQNQPLNELTGIVNSLILESYKRRNYEGGIYYTNGYSVIFQKEGKINYKKIPVSFISPYYQPIYKNINSFAQNVPFIAKKINYNVMEYLCYERENVLIKQNLLGIGGEFISYFVNLHYRVNHYVKYFGFTNNKYIADDAIFNSKQHYISLSRMNIFYHKNYDVIYNEIDNLLTNILKNKSDVLINLSKLHMTLPDLLIKNKAKINRIIIVSCNEKNLTNRIDDKFLLKEKKNIINPVNNKIISISYFEIK